CRAAPHRARSNRNLRKPNRVAIPVRPTRQPEGRRPANCSLILSMAIAKGLRCCGPGRASDPILSNLILPFFSGLKQNPKPGPKGEIDRHVELENKPAENGNSCEPGESRPKKCQPSNITQQKVMKPSIAHLFAWKPNCGDERCERNPTKPVEIKRRKTACVEKPASDGSKPRPKPQQPG